MSTLTRHARSLAFATFILSSANHSFAHESDYSGNFDSMSLAGSFNDWTAGSADHHMHFIADNLWRLALDLQAGDQFKFTPFADWSNSFGDVDQNGTADTSGGGNLRPTQGSGSYIVVFNDETLAYSIDYVSDLSLPPMAIAGSDQTVELGAMVMLDAGQSQDPDGGEISYLWSDDLGTMPMVHLMMNEVGVFSYTLTVTDDEGDTDTGTVTITVVESVDWEANYASMHMVGNFNSWSLTASPMTLVADNLWEFHNTYTEDTNFKFVPESWNLSFGDVNQDGVADTQGGGNISLPNGPSHYRVHFNDETLVYTIIEHKVSEQPMAMITAGNTTINQGDTITFEGRSSHDDKGVVSYLWSNGATTPATSIMFHNAGETTVSLTVTDADDNSHTANVTVTVIGTSNNAPTARAGNDISINVGDTATLNASSSTDPEGDTLTYSWDNGFGNGIQVSKLMDTVGSFDVTLTATDSHGLSDTDIVTVNVTATVNHSPTARAGNDITIEIGNIANLSATASTDPEGDALTFSWDQGFGDGAQVSKMMDTVGSFDVTLTVTDTVGNTDTDTVSINVIEDSFSANYPTMHLVGGLNGWNIGANPMALIADNTWQATVELVGDIQFKFVPVNWSLSFGDINADGTADTSGGGNIVTAQGAGEYTITFNDQTRVYSLEVYTGPVPPTAIITADNTDAKTGATVMLSAANSTDNGAINGYLWSTGETTPAIAYSEDTEGEYTVSVTVTDDEALSSSSSITLMFADNRAPVANAGSDITVYLGGTAQLSAAGSSDPDGDALSYVWDSEFGNGANVSATMDTMGQFEVTLTATDTDGLTSTDSVFVNVIEQSFTGNYPSMSIADRLHGFDLSAVPMELIANNLWAVTTQMDPNNDFKFVPVDWSLSFGDVDGNGVADTLGGGNIGGDQYEAGTYLILFNDETRHYSIRRVDNKPLTVYGQIFFRGSNMAGNLYPMAHVGDYQWETTTSFDLGNNEGFKFDVLGDSSIEFGEVTPDQSLPRVATAELGANQILVQGPGEFKITFNEMTLQYSIEQLNSERLLARNGEPEMIEIAGSNARRGYSEGGNNAGFDEPEGLLLDNNGNIFVADNYAHVIRRIDLDSRRDSNIVETIAGRPNSPSYSNDVSPNDDPKGSDIRFNRPRSMAFDRTGNTMYISDSSNLVIRAMNMATKEITLLAGRPGQGGALDGVGNNAMFGGYSGNTESAGEIRAYHDDNGNQGIYFADAENHAIRHLNILTKEVTTIAGQLRTHGWVDGSTSESRFDKPLGLEVELDDSNAPIALYVAEANNRTIRKINLLTNTVITVAGFGTVDPNSHYERTIGEEPNLNPNIPTYRNGPGQYARFRFPFGIRLDGQGNLLIIDGHNNLLRLLNLQTRMVMNVAGVQQYISGDGVWSSRQSDYNTTGTLQHPSHLEIESAKVIYVSDRSAGVIKRIRLR